MRFCVDVEVQFHRCAFFLSFENFKLEFYTLFRNTRKRAFLKRIGPSYFDISVCFADKQAEFRYRRSPWFNSYDYRLRLDAFSTFENKSFIRTVLSLEVNRNRYYLV